MLHKFVDIHSHILPGVDDGSPNMDTSMEMLNMAYNEGVRHLFLTPHYIRGSNHYRPEDLDTLYCELKERSQAEFPRLHLHLGNEVYYIPGIAEDIRNGNIHTMRGTRYVLVEFDITSSYTEIYNALKEFKQMRLFPVVAHVERYQCLVKNYDLMIELKEDLGAYFQMNVNGVLGGKLNAKSRWCRSMVEDELITFLGTDAHDLRHRPPKIQEAGQWMSKRISKEYQKYLFWANARFLVRDEYI